MGTVAHRQKLRSFEHSGGYKENRVQKCGNFGLASVARTLMSAAPGFVSALPVRNA